MFSLPLGSSRTAAAHFRHDPPTEAEMENAIQAVEDVVMPLHRRIAPGATLVTSDPAVREFMHHLKFAAITWKPASR